MEAFGLCHKGIPVKNKLFIRIAAPLMAFAVTATSITPAVAQQAAPSNNLCVTPPGGVQFGFFNGVNTTEQEADQALIVFGQKYGLRTAQGESVSYEAYYNYSEGFADFVETFDHRLQENGGILAGRFELFFEALKGNGTWLDAISDAVPAFAATVSAFVDWSAAAIPRMLTKMMAEPSTELTLSEHRLRVDNGALEGRKMLFVAHSQGTLFANIARDYAVKKMAANSVKVIYIAPAAPLIIGSHTLADKDVVIMGLRLAGSVAPITDTIPPILARTPGINGKKDFLGHGLQEIYLNPAHTTASRIHTGIMDAFQTLVAPPVQAQTGFFSVTLSWNGPGDVDLHTFEPAGSHVFFDQPIGYAGRLDVDNRAGFGPEHYFASCDANKLQVGTYAISLANYTGAAGRKATVQIASNAEGVLGTKTVTMGAATAWMPSVDVFKVDVKQDPRTGKLRASIGS